MSLEPEYQTIHEKHEHVMRKAIQRSYNDNHFSEEEIIGTLTRIEDI